MSDCARFLRQMLLAEVGEAGQARLAAAVADVGAPSEGGPALAHDVASRYARGAGFARVEAGAVDVDELAPLAMARVAAAREVLAGSRAALASMRSALGLVDAGGSTSCGSQTRR